MKEHKRRAAFRKGIRRGVRSSQGLGLRDLLIIIPSTVRSVVWFLLNAVLVLWDLNPVSVAIRRWRKSQPKQASIALTVRPRFRDLIGDWFLSYEGRKRKLLQWVHSVLPWLSDDVMDFGPSWQDGIVLCALMDTLNPGSCLQVHLLKPHHRVNNCRLGIQLAMTYLEINQAILSPEEMSLAEEDTEVKVVELVQLVRWHFLKQGGKKGKVESQLGSEEPFVPFKCEARGTGIKAGIVGKRTKFNLFVESVKHLHLSIEIKGPNNEYNKETIISMHPRGSSKYSHHNVAIATLEDEAKAKVVEDGEGHSFLRQKSFDEGPSYLVIPFDYQCVGEGRFLATYIPRNAGLHYVTILSHGNHIPGSPFEVKVSDWVSSWNLVPKGRVVPFDMINSYVDGGTKEGVKSQDKVRCKLSSVASVSKQLTTMRRRILKKVITQGGREIIVKHTGDIAINSPVKQETNSCYQLQGKCPSIPSTVNEKCKGNGEIGDSGDLVHPIHTFPADQYSLTESQNATKTATATHSNGAVSPLPLATSTNVSDMMRRSDENNLIDDLKNIKMDVSDKWKMAALKVSINEMTTKCEDEVEVNNGLENLNSMEKQHCINNSSPHNILIKISQCSTRESFDSPNKVTIKESLNKEFVKNEGHSLQNVDRSTTANTDEPSNCKVVSDNVLNFTDTKEPESPCHDFSQSKPHEQDIRQRLVSESHESQPTFQRWSFLRENYLNYLQNVKNQKTVDDDKEQSCPTCNKTLPGACTCCVDSGNESNTYFEEETDGEESLIFGFDVGDVTESSIDSMGLFQNYFNCQINSHPGQTEFMDDQKRGSPENETHLIGNENDRQQRSLISFRKERGTSGQDVSSDLISDVDIDFLDGDCWKTLRKAHSFSHDFNLNGKKRPLISHTQSQSFDNVMHGSTAGNHNHFLYDNQNTKRVNREIERQDENIEQDVSTSHTTPAEASKVSIYKNSKMVKSIFYIKAKLNDQSFRSYSLPEQSEMNDDESKQEGVHNSEQGIKPDRFAHVKRAWKSFDDDILNLLNDNKDYIELNRGGQNQLPEKICAEISLKEVDKSDRVCSLGDLEDVDEIEEILEVVIENDVLHDGFATENEDDESLLPTTPTSIRIESGLSSMRNSPQKILGEAAPCVDCLVTIRDRLKESGLSPSSIEMNKSDNSDWSDDFIPEFDSRQQTRKRRNRSPHITDLPKFPSTKSPEISTAATLSPSFNLPSNNFVTLSNAQYRLNDYHQGFGYNVNSGNHKPTRKPSSNEDSDIFTEDSSISDSVSGEDAFVFEMSNFHFENVINKNATKHGFLKKPSTITIKPMAVTPEPSSLQSKSKLSLEGERKLNGKIAKESPRHTNDLKSTDLDYHSKQRKKPVKMEEVLNNAHIPDSDWRVCHCKCQKMRLNDDSCYIPQKQCCVRNPHWSTRRPNVMAQFQSDENTIGLIPYIEKEIIPTKYKDLTVMNDTINPQRHSFYQKDFHWDLQNENEPFVEKTLTPTKYRKKHQGANVSSARAGYNETNKNKFDSILQSQAMPKPHMNTSTRTNDTFDSNTKSAYPSLYKDNLKGGADNMSNFTEIGESIWDSVYINNDMEDHGFIKFVYEMMMKGDGDQFTKDPRLLGTTRTDYNDPVAMCQEPNVQSNRTDSQRMSGENEYNGSTNMEGLYRLCRRRIPQY